MALPPLFFTLCIYRVLRNHYPGTYVVLCYHEVKNGQRKKFKRQIDTLNKIANPVAINTNRNTLKKLHNVVITFDDGFQSVLNNAYPVLEKHNIPFAMFLPSGRLGQHPGWITDESHINYNECIIVSEELQQLRKDLVTIGSHSVTHSKLTLLQHDKIVL